LNVQLDMIRRNVISLVSDPLIPFFIKEIATCGITDKYHFTDFLLVSQLVTL